MPSVYDTLYNWARKTTTSMGELCLMASQRDDMDNELDGLIYRLKHWPELVGFTKTADVFRALSVMSTRPVNRHWILSNTKLRAAQVDQLLQRLVDEGAVDVVDGSKFPSRAASAATCPAR